MQNDRTFLSVHRSNGGKVRVRKKYAENHVACKKDMESKHGRSHDHDLQCDYYWNGSCDIERQLLIRRLKSLL